jgi:hypothetical protein
MQAVMRDPVLVLALAVLFATAVTVHVAILVGLVRRTPRWYAFAALLLPVLAPLFAFIQRMRARSLLWVGAMLLYGAVLLLSLK